MEQGPVEQQILDQCRRQKLPVPDRIKNKPQIETGNEFYWQAYMDLMTERSIGMVEGPVPWSAVLRYSWVHGLNYFDFDDLWEVIKHMDTAFLQYREKTMKKKTGK